MTEQTLFEYADLARAQAPLARDKDPITSHEAADKMVKSGKLTKQQNSVLKIIARYCKNHKDFTPLELTDGHWTALYYAIQRRKNELNHKGYIESTGEVRNGREVWRLVRK